MGPFWRPGEIVKGASKLMQGNLDLFEIFISFLFCESTSSKGKRIMKEKGKRWCGTISKVQSYLVTLKEAEKDKDEGRGENSSSFFMQVKGLFLKTLFRF
jgi:hypothetical protein